jgi:hypothetical protein
MPADETAAVKNRRRVSDAALPRVMTAIGPPPSNQRGESCPRRLTEARRFHDGRVNHQSVIGSPSRGWEKRAADIAMSFKSHRFVLFDHR